MTDTLFNILTAYFILYITLIGFIVFVGFYFQRGKENNYANKPAAIMLDEIVVLIPFRNEEHRISVLLDSIKRIQTHPKEYVFVNDHSNDNGSKLISNELGTLNFRVIDLPDDVMGKKMALRYAIEKTESTYILTFDADVVLDQNYFNSIANLSDADMYVLPAVMKAKRLIEYIYEIDLVLVNAANTGLSGLSRPIMASGANLLYRRDTFNRVDNVQSHISSASGDDTYLLRDFRENKTSVRLNSDISCAIHTETPQSLKEFIDQRLRWIGKTGDIRDHLSTSLAIIQSFLTLFFLSLLIFSLITANWELLAVLFISKTAIDMVVFFPYFTRIKRLTTWFFIPLYEIIFPFYVLTILILMFFYKPKWKGRKIYETL